MLAEVSQRFAEGAVGAVARITPHLAIGLLRLLIRRCQQRAPVLFCQRLPMQIEGTGLSGFARALAATVLMHHDPAQRLDSRRNPHRILNRKNQFARLG